MKSLVDFLNRLEKNSIYYTLGKYCDDAIMVSIDVPGEKWEVEFFKDGEIQVEIFKSNGEIEDKKTLEELFLRHSN